MVSITRLSLTDIERASATVFLNIYKFSGVTILA